MLYSTLLFLYLHWILVVFVLECTPCFDNLISPLELINYLSICSAEKVIGCNLPSLQVLHASRTP